MNILVVTDKLYPDEVGGSCTYAYETITNMCKDNNVDIFTCYPEKSYNDKYFNKCNVYRYFNKRNIIMSSYKLKKILETNKYEKVIFHSALSFFLYYIIRKKIKSKQEIIVVYHGPWHKEAELKFKSTNKFLKLQLVPIMKKIQYFIGNCEEVKLIFLSNYMRQELININPKIENNTYRIIPGGVNKNKFNSCLSKKDAREKLNIDKDDFVIFSLRRLEYRMGLQNVIDILDQVEVNGKKSIKFIIGGKGPYENVLKDKCNKLIKNKCYFKGFIDEEELEFYFKAADIFIVPSIDLEGFGLVILESLAMGLPVIATPQGGMAEMKNKINGLYLSKTLEKEDILDEINNVGNMLSNQDISIDVSKYKWENITNEILKFI